MGLEEWGGKEWGGEREGSGMGKVRNREGGSVCGEGVGWRGKGWSSWGTLRYTCSQEAVLFYFLFRQRTIFVFIEIPFFSKWQHLLNKRIVRANITAKTSLASYTKLGKVLGYKSSTCRSQFKVYIH